MKRFFLVRTCNMYDIPKIFLAYIGKVKPFSLFWQILNRSKTFYCLTCNIFHKHGLYRFFFIFCELCFTRFAEDLLTYSFLRAIVCSFFSLLPCYVLLFKIARVWILLFLHWNLLFNIVMYVLENAVSA